MCSLGREDSLLPARRPFPKVLWRVKTTTTVVWKVKNHDGTVGTHVCGGRSAAAAAAQPSRSAGRPAAPTIRTKKLNQQSIVN